MPVPFIRRELEHRIENAKSELLGAIAEDLADRPPAGKNQQPPILEIIKGVCQELLDACEPEAEEDA